MHPRDLVDGTEPIRIVLFLGLLVKSCDKEVVIPISVLSLDRGIELTTQLDLGLDLVAELLLRDLLEAVAHDGNNHVQHGDLRDEGCSDEEDVAEACFWVIGVVTHGERSQ